MFRKVALALVAATMLTAPVMAQNATAPAKYDAKAAVTPVKTIKAEKTTLKHRKYVSHRHGTRLAMHVRHVKFAHHINRAKHPYAAGIKTAVVKPVHAKHVVIKHVAGKYTVTKHVAAKHVMTKHVAGKHVAKRYVAKHYVAKRHVAKHHIASKYVAKKHAAGTKVAKVSAKPVIRSGTN